MAEIFIFLSFLYKVGVRKKQVFEGASDSSEHVRNYAFLF